jgi:uncharacterized membrane protein
MALPRLLRHLTTTHLSARRRFPARALDAIEAAVQRAENSAQAQIRVVIEAALPALEVVKHRTPRDRAVQLFAMLRVWDTEHNNGVLLYLGLADRVVEIVADRGLGACVPAEQWQAVCRQLEARFGAGDFANGTVAGVDAIGALLARHFPRRAGLDAGAGAAPGGGARGQAGQRSNELPDRPTLL